MKKIKLISGFAATAIFLSSCTSSLPLTKDQALTMSPQAVETLKTLKLLRIPLISVSDKTVLKVRNQFAEIEKGELAEMKNKFNPTIQDTIINNVKVVIVTPRNIKPENKNKIILYIHGGGFVMGSASDRTGMLMANELGLKMYSVNYQLAPEAKFPVAMNESVEVYKYLLSKYEPKNITGVSTSAGCAHMLAMTLKAKQLNLPMYASLALLSPAVDLSNAGDTPTSNDGRDLLAYHNMGDKMMITPFAGKTPLNDPLLSPIYSDYSSDFPPTVIVSSTRDVLLSGSTRLYWKLRDASVPTELLVSEGMWHAFTNFTDIPEAVKSRKAVEEFIRNAFKSKAVSSHTISSNKAIVERFINEVVNGGNFNLVPDLWAKDMTWHGGSMGDIQGVENYKNMLKAAANGSFSNMKLDIKDIVEEDGKVVLYFSNSGKNIGDFMGHKATGKTAKWNGMGIYKIENGKIKEAWFSEDILDMFNQLGFLSK